MDINKVEELIKVLESSKVNEICVSKGTSSVLIKKGAKKAVVSAVKSVNKQISAKQGKAADSAKPVEYFIDAPMVGMFHVVDGLAEVGGIITAGQVVGSIESMKLLNDVKTQESCCLAEILVEDGMPVEYGQHLYRIEPI